MFYFFSRSLTRSNHFFVKKIKLSFFWFFFVCQNSKITRFGTFVLSTILNCQIFYIVLPKFQKDVAQYIYVHIKFGWNQICTLRVMALRTFFSTFNNFHLSYFWQFLPKFKIIVAKTIYVTFINKRRHFGRLFQNGCEMYILF